MVLMSTTLRLVSKRRIYLYIRVDTLGNRAGERRPLEDGALFVVDRHGREVQPHVDARDTARIGGHVFGDVDLKTAEVDAEVAGLDPHDGHHTAPERGGYEVGGGEALALALVVGGGVGFDRVAALEVLGVGAEVALVCYGGCHGIDIEQVKGTNLFHLYTQLFKGAYVFTSICLLL